MYTATLRGKASSMGQEISSLGPLVVPSECSSSTTCGNVSEANHKQ
eukprot:gene8030-17487_t